MRFESVSRTHVGLKRPVNEDNYLSRPEVGLFAVADGMGGHEAGEVASARVVEGLGLIKAITPATIVATLDEVNADLVALARDGEGTRTIGSTVAGLLIEGGKATCFWAGDSRAYRLRGRSLQRLSRDHSLVQQLLDAGMIDPERVDDHPNGNVITRAVGASETLRVDLAETDAAPGDLFLLASDGVTRMMADGEIAAALADTPSLHEIADAVVWTVLRRGAPDNLTLVLIRLV